MTEAPHPTCLANRMLLHSASSKSTAFCQAGGDALNVPTFRFWTMNTLSPLWNTICTPAFTVWKYYTVTFSRPIFGFIGCSTHLSNPRNHWSQAPTGVPFALARWRWACNILDFQGLSMGNDCGCGSCKPRFRPSDRA